MSNSLIGVSSYAHKYNTHELDGREYETYNENVVSG